MAKTGRPPKLQGDEWVNLGFRLPRETYHKLRDASLRETRRAGRHVGMTEIVRTVVEEYLRTQQENAT